MASIFGSLGSAQGASAGSIESSYGRVVEVILDSFHPQYESKGSLALNGILYRELNEATSEEEEGELKFAYIGNVEFKRIPLKNEIVELKSYPSEDRNDNPDAKRVYWTKIIPIWSHPNHNIFPDTVQFPEQEANPDFGPFFEEKEFVAPLQAFPGDTIIEGRHGNSIRLGGTKYDSNIFTDNSNNSQPYTIISNGQAEPTNGDESIVEDINKDPASIYLGSDHIFELEQANEKRDAFLEEPQKADKYKGKQIIINSGRLYFNGNEEGIFLSAKEGIGLNSKFIGLDGEDYIGLDAKKIYLGTKAQQEQEPVLKGQITTDWLEDFLSQFEALVKGMALAPVAPAPFVAKVIATSNSILPLIPQLKNLLRQLHSKKTFTE